MIKWLDPNEPPHFPQTNSALEEPDGLLAAGGKLSVEWLQAAYRQGIFPWFSDGEPILWWSPAPRTVVYPEEFHCSKSLSKLARGQRYRVSQNDNFEAVVRACAAQRKDQSGTWINSQMIDAYIAMHAAGFAESIECYRDEALVGGLYGVVLGQVFFGESMFSLEANTSKLCLKNLTESNRFKLIDCQMATPHLDSLGAREIDREDFEKALNQWT